MKLSASTSHIQQPVGVLGLIAALLRLRVRMPEQFRLFSRPEIIGRNEAVRRMLAAYQKGQA